MSGDGESRMGSAQFRFQGSGYCCWVATEKVVKGGKNGGELGATSPDDNEKFASFSQKSSDLIGFFCVWHGGSIRQKSRNPTVCLKFRRSAPFRGV
jgi:hypothetical protein